MNLQRLGFPPIKIAEKMAKQGTMQGFVFPEKAVKDQAFFAQGARKIPQGEQQDEG